MIPLTAETISLVTAILGALGVGGVVVKLAEGIIASVTGRHDRETARVQRVMDERDAAEARAREEARRARIVTEYAHALRVQMIEASLDPAPFPSTDRPNPSPQED